MKRPKVPENKKVPLRAWILASAGIYDSMCEETGVKPQKGRLPDIVDTWQNHYMEPKQAAIEYYHFHHGTYYSDSEFRNS